MTLASDGPHIEMRVDVNTALDLYVGRHTQKMITLLVNVLTIAQFIEITVSQKALII